MVNIEEMAVFCKKKGIVFQDSEIYGSLSGFWDFGPLGVEIKNNIKSNWWKRFIQDREDMVGMDGSIITHKKIWEASGHVQNFKDIMITCKKCKHKVRADIFIEDKLNINAEGWNAKKINETINKNNLKCPECENAFADANDFNLMFETIVGPNKNEENTAYLRPETAQLIFADFKLIFDTARMQLPFGIGQIGKAFRNEISPRDFLFRSREFEQMEIEYFVHPDDLDNCPFIEEILEFKLNILTAEIQKESDEGIHTVLTVQDLLDKKIVTSWHVYWLVEFYKWFLDLGIKPENLRLREHRKDELAHYAGACFDIEYHFPFGWKEIHGNADRTNFDLNQHIKVSGKDLQIFDEKTKGKIVPYVGAEPSQGVERAMLALLFDAYEVKEKEGKPIVTLKLHPDIAPIKVGVFPLVNKLKDEAKELFSNLKSEFHCIYDKSGSIGRRYARADEQGIPYCVTFDFDTKENNKVTIRDRDTEKQILVKIDDLKEILRKLLNNEIKFEKAGELMEN